MEQLPNSGEIMPLNSLKQRSSMANDGLWLQIEDGIAPVKLLLLALRATRFFITSSVVDGSCPVKKLLEIFSTLRGRPEFEDCRSSREPDRRLKLTSRAMMLLENTNSIGRLPASELWDRLRRSNPVRLLRDGGMLPLRPLEASMTSVTTPSLLQLIPSHWQQSVLFTHDTLRPPLPSGESPSRKSMREILSCSMQELMREAKESRRTQARTMKGTGNLVVLLLLHGKLSGCMVLS
uniref:Uncharacterized protein n=1 Tax=Arundo donax TaxID=35708 RepID=A0A0A9C134_ARUDO